MKALCLIFLYIMIVSGQAQLPQAFIKKASIQQDDAEAFAVAVGEDGTVFVAYRDGLRAYRYDGHSFNLNAYIYNDVEGRDLAIDSDGTIFVAYMWDGLRAYTYDGSSFSNTAHIADQGLQQRRSGLPLGVRSVKTPRMSYRGRGLPGEVFLLASQLIVAQSLEVDIRVFFYRKSQA